jgi:hypothetical protein
MQAKVLKSGPALLITVGITAKIELKLLGLKFS